MNKRVQFYASAGLLLASILLAYSNHWNNIFHLDDNHTVVQNLYIRSLGNIPLFFQDARTFSVISQSQSYRPVVSASLAIDYWLSQTFSGDGLIPSWYHLSTFLFFLLQGVFLFYLFRPIVRYALDSSERETSDIGTGQSDWIALAAVALYMLHPSNAETINYIIQRGDSLSTFFLVLGFVLYQHSTFARRNYLYLIPVLVGCLTKPPALMFAPLLLVYIILFEQEQPLWSKEWINSKKLWKTVIPSFLLVFVLYCLQRYMEPHFVAGRLSLFPYLITQPYVALHYVLNFFVPVFFSAIYDWQPFNSVTDPRCLIGLIFLATLIGLILYTARFRTWRPVSFGLAWFLIALIPTSVVPLSEVANDHRVFFPYVGLSLAVVWTIYRFFAELALRNPRPRLATRQNITIAFLMLLTIFAYGTYKRNQVWRSEESLWHEATIKSPNSAINFVNYGYPFMLRGSYDTAIVNFERSLQLAPERWAVYFLLGTARDGKGDVAGAVKAFNIGMKYDSIEPQNRYLYGLFLDRHGRTSDAIDQYYASLAIVESYPAARHLLMEDLFKAGRADELRRVVTRTLQISSGDPVALKYAARLASGPLPPATAPTPTSTSGSSPALAYFNQSLGLIQAHDYPGAIAAAHKAIELQPNYPEAWSNISALSNVLGQFSEARVAAEQATKLKPDYPQAWNNLSEACLHLGQFAEGKTAAQRATTLKPDYAQAWNSLAESSNRLGNFAQGKAAAERAIHLQPQFPKAQENLNWALRELAKGHR